MQQAILIGILNVLKNRWFWIILGLIILFLVLRRNWNRIKSSRLFNRDRGDYSEGFTAPPGQNTSGMTQSQIAAARKKDLERLAEDLYREIYATFGYPTKFIKEANTLNDTELKYLSQYYRKALTKGNTLYKDVDDEFLPHTNEDEKLLARLSKIGEN
jgi:hypothetical protein